MKTQQRKVARNEWVRQQRLAGRSMKSIADELGMTENGVRYICEKVGCRGVMVSLEAWYENSRRASRETGKRLMKTDAQLNEELRAFGFEYVSGYKGCDSKVRIRCLKCGTELERWYSFTRQEPHHFCPECQRIESERRKSRKRWLKAHQQELQKQETAKQIELRLGVCAECGHPFIKGDRTRYCSTACAKRRANNHKDRRLTAANIIDKDITLERLYKRDSGVCYLCGKACDWTDFIVEDDVTICGDNYPSIEHVEPLSRGGKHSWQNVRLACRKCNYEKSDTPPSIF